MAAVSCRRRYELKGEKDQWPMKGNDQNQAMTTLKQEKMNGMGLGGLMKGFLVNIKAALGILSRSNGHSL